MGLSSPGIGSGLDVQGIVTSLVSAQITPVQNQHDQQVKLINTKISDLGQLKSSLSSLQTSLNNLANLSNLFPVKATASDSSFFSATTTSKATKGTYQVEVQNLAKQQSIASDYVSDVNTVGNGTLNIAIGQYTTDPVTHAVTFNPSSTAHITIAPGNESLTAIRDAINSSNAGVNANIVTDSLGSRLTLTSTQTGQKNAIQVTSTGGTFATSNVLKYDPTDTSHADGLTQKVAAEDSMVAINGLLIQDS